MTECYCAALRLAARKLTATYDDALAPEGISVAQYSLLRKIEAAEEPMSLSRLGEESGLERSTVGRNSKVLCRLGLIETVQGDDAREACLALLPAGRRTLAKAEPLWRQAQQRVEEMIGGREAGQLRKLLDAIT